MVDVTPPPPLACFPSTSSRALMLDMYREAADAVLASHLPSREHHRKQSRALYELASFNSGGEDLHSLGPRRVRHKRQVK